MSETYRTGSFNFETVSQGLHLGLLQYFCNSSSAFFVSFSACRRYSLSVKSFLFGGKRRFL